MISILDKKKCCGCSACAQRCPKHCIKMIEDSEGFLYPKVDGDTCIDCGLCERVCPIQNPGEDRVPLAVYAAKNPNEVIRRQSSSGGIFTILAEQIIDEGGVVFGAAFNDKWEVEHSYVENKEQLVKFRGSKYVQSKIGESYKDAKSFLKEGRRVLFSGTPCQIAALKKYLRKNYENLFTVDFICHGVPSPGVFRTYLQEEINIESVRQGGGKNTVLHPCIPLITESNGLDYKGMKIKSISFRDKRHGWKKYGFALQLSKASAAEEKNSVSLSYASLNKNLFLRGFLKNLYLRPSCYACKTRDFKSGSDVTLADFWGIGKLNRSMDDDKGVSMLIINTKEGQDYCKSFCVSQNLYSINEIRRFNPAAYHSCVEPANRSIFFGMNKRVHERISILARLTFKEKIMIILKTIIREYLKIKV